MSKSEQSDVLHRVVQGHLLPDQPFDGKQLDDLILVPDGKPAALCHHLQQDSAFGHLMVDTYWLYRLAGHSACLDKQRRA